MKPAQKRIEFPRSERVQDPSTKEWHSHEVGRAELDAHLALGWRVVHLAGSGTDTYVPHYCAILEPPPGLDSTGELRP